MGLAAAVIGAGALTAVGGIASASMQSGAAKSAASTQAAAENHASDQMQAQYQQTRADLSPYNQAGQDATAQIQNTSPFSYGAFNFSPTQAQLEQTPGYQFTLSQGLKSTQNGYAAQGLGTSGAALKGAANYATGLADSTYQNQFQNALSGYNANYNTAQGAYTTNLNRLQSLAQQGENAASQTGAYGTQTGANIGQTAVGAANAQAAGQVGSANAISSGINTGVGGLSNAFLQNSFLSQSGMYAPATLPAGFGAAGGVGAVPEFY